MEDIGNNHHKRQRQDWNAQVIKEMRDVFARNKMKPIMISEGEGKKKRNAPWRVWFDALVARRFETQLPEHILKEARARYNVHQGSYRPTTTSVDSLQQEYQVEPSFYAGEQSGYAPIANVNTLAYPLPEPQIYAHNPSPSSDPASPLHTPIPNPPAIPYVGSPQERTEPVSPIDPKVTYFQTFNSPSFSAELLPSSFIGQGFSFSTSSGSNLTAQLVQPHLPSVPPTFAPPAAATTVPKRESNEQYTSHSRSSNHYIGPNGPNGPNGPISSTGHTGPIGPIGPIGPTGADSAPLQLLHADRIQAGYIRAENIRTENLQAQHVHQLSDIRLKKNVEEFQGGMDIIRKLKPYTFHWKDNAMEIANSPNPSAYVQSTDSSRISSKPVHHSNTLHSPPHQAPPNYTSTSTRAKDKSTTYPSKAYSNMPPAASRAVHNSNSNYPNSNGTHPKMDKRANYNETQSTNSTHHGKKAPSQINDPTIPPPYAQPNRNYPQHYANTAHAQPNRNLPQHSANTAHAQPNNRRDYYNGNFREDEESFESEDEYESEEDEAPKVIGFIAQNLQAADPRLVKEDPRNGILAIDQVGITATVVQALQELDIRVTEVEHQTASRSPTLPLSPPPPVLLSTTPPKGNVINLCTLEKGYIVINEKALNFLRTLPTISILSICGPRNIGKSFFCNMFIPNSEKKFVVGTNEGTKGLWIYNRFISDKSGHKNYLVLDTPGIDSTDENIHKLICLVWLISSVLVFKDYRNLDIKNFEIFTSVRNILQKVKFVHEYPALAGLIDDDLQVLDPEQYMIKFLNDKRHSNICEAVKKCFKHRNVLQLIPPKKQELDSKDYYSGSLYASFLKVKEDLERFLLNFTIGTKDASGIDFAKYLLSCVKELNDVRA